METLTEQTGFFFDEQTVDSLCSAVKEFETKTYLATDCRQNALRFSRPIFRMGFETLMEFFSEKTSASNPSKKVDRVSTLQRRQERDLPYT